MAMFVDSTDNASSGPVVKSEASYYCADKVFADAQVKLASILWQSLHQEIVHTPIDCIPAIQSEIERVLLGVTSNAALDSSVISNLVGNLFDRVNNFISVQKDFAGRFTDQFFHEQINVVNAHFRTLIQEEHNLLRGRAKDYSDLLEAESENEKLKKELETSNNRIIELKGSILQRDNLLSENDMSFASVRTEIDRLKNIPRMSDAEASQLRSVEDELKSCLEEFKQF